MVVIGRLEPQNWMIATETRRVISALMRQGQDVRFVGGCVRDALLGLPVSDIDIATPDKPEKVMDLLESVQIKAVPTGLNHGTVTAICDQVPFEITTLRLDWRTDGRHADVSFCTSWEQDAARRDLTINALSCRPDGQVFDYFGGLDDLEKGLVRFVGSAHRRIEEDALRLLRYFRFFAYYGGQEHNAEALEACATHKAMIGGISAERIRCEFFKLLSAPNPLFALETMQSLGLLENFLPEGRSLFHYGRYLQEETVIDRQLLGDHIPLIRLAALYPQPREALRPLPESLRFSRREKDFFLAIIFGREGLDLAVLNDAPEAFFYRQQPAVGQAKILLAGLQGSGSSPLVEELLSRYRAFQKPFFPLSGRDLISEGLLAGARLGDVLRSVEEWWIQEKFQPDHQACLAKALEHQAFAGRFS